MRRVLSALLLLLVAAAPARAAIPSPALVPTLLDSATPAELRARLATYAREQQPKAAAYAGEAWYYQGLSWDRGGHVDSAVACYRRAADLRTNREEILALADALLARNHPGDAAEVVQRLSKAVGQSEGGSDEFRAPFVARMGWAHFLEGHADTAGTLLAASGEYLMGSPEWRTRWARIRLANHDRLSALKLVERVAALSRLQDEDAVDLMKQAAADQPGPDAAVTATQRDMKVRDDSEDKLIRAWGGHRVRFLAHDRFPLGGIAFLPAQPRHAKVAVVVIPPTDTLASYDTLVVTLERRGIAVLLLAARGSGWSVAPSCPTADAWRGREEALDLAVARDVRDCLRAIASRGPVDTTRYLVVGCGAASSVAVQAARLDRRVAAVLLPSPTPNPVDLGADRAALAQTQVPLFLQSSPEDFNFGFTVTEYLYQAGNRAASRVVEGTTPGHGAAQFREDPALLDRFIRWLDSSWGARRSAPAPRPAAHHTR